MSRLNWLFHPILILVCSILALATSLFLYIYWYIEVSLGLKTLINKFNLDPKQFLDLQTWVVILVLSLLVGIILMGISLFFIYHMKTFQLYRLQNNFINNFTHELKTPVASIKLYLETFQKYEIEKDDQLTYIRYMIDDANRLTNNINRILNLAKIESKAYKDEFEVIDLTTVIQTFLEKHQGLFRASRINLYNTDGDFFFLSVSQSLFEMLLMNLLTNAIKYNQSDIPKIAINFEKSKKYVLIHFKDNGIGLDKKEIKKIFKKFYQVGTSNNMTAMGSGLGLYLAQLIVNIHKGKITAASKGPGFGTTFTLKFKNHINYKG
jgi:two-component system, OmpR family, phosphate regulon sensor histidine kinase PhoR